MTPSPVDWLPDPIRTWLGSMSGLEFLAWVAGFAVAGWGIYRLAKKVLPGTVAVAKGVVNAAAILTAVQGLPEFIEKHEKLATKVDEIHHETHTNNGSSIKDSQARTEAAVQHVQKSLEGVHGRLETLEGGVKSLEGEVKALHRADDELRSDLEQTNPPDRSA